MGSVGLVKTTVDLADPLLKRAKQLARRTHRPLRELIELGLQRVLEEESAVRPYKLPDRSVGERSGENPLETLSWDQLRDEIYGGR